MGPEGAVNVLYRRELDQAEDPAALAPSASPSSGRSSRIRSSRPARGFIDDIIAPARHAARS